MAESVREVERNRNNKIRLMSENGGFLSAKSENGIGKKVLNDLNGVFYLGNVEKNSFDKYSVASDDRINRASEFCPDVDELDYKGICPSNDENCRKKRCSDRYDSSESSDSGIAVSSSASSGTSDITDPGSPFSTSSDDSTSSPGKCKVVVGKRCKSEEKSPSWSQPTGRCRSEEKTWTESWEEKRQLNRGEEEEEDQREEQELKPPPPSQSETEKEEKKIQEKEEKPQHQQQQQSNKTDQNFIVSKTDFKMAPNVPSSASSPCDLWTSMTETNTANDTATHFNHFDETQCKAITTKRLKVDAKESMAPLNINNNIVVNVPSLILSEIEPDIADNKRKNSRSDNCEGPKVKMRRSSHESVGPPTNKEVTEATKPTKNGMKSCEKMLNGGGCGGGGGGGGIGVKPKGDKGRHQGKITEYFKSQIKTLVGLKRDFGLKKDSGTLKSKTGIIVGHTEEEPPFKKLKGDEEKPQQKQQQQQLQHIEAPVFVKPSPKPPQTVLPLTTEPTRLLLHLSKSAKAADFLLSKPAGTKTLFNKILQNHKNRKLAESYLKSRSVLKPKPAAETEAVSEPSCAPYDSSTRNATGEMPNSKVEESKCSNLDVDDDHDNTVQNKALDCNSCNVITNNSTDKSGNSSGSCSSSSSSSSSSRICGDSSEDSREETNGRKDEGATNLEVISSRSPEPDSSSSSSSSSPILSAPKTIRFPAVRERSEKHRTQAREVISCRWNGCSIQSNSASGLLEHLQTAHVLTQVSGEKFVCLWVGCKVFDQKSCSRTWLERHVLSHAGSKPFRCIVDGCGQGFSTQAILERHVNNHFAADVKKALDNSIVHKLFRRNGKKLRYRRQPWSARMFDFFDCGIMEGLEHRLVKLTQVRTGGDITEIPGKSLALTSQVIARRMTENGRQQFLLRWSPPNIIEDEWVYENEVTKKKMVSIPSLSPSVSSSLQETLELVTRSSRTYRTGRRKNKGVVASDVNAVAAEVVVGAEEKSIDLEESVESVALPPSPEPEPEKVAEAMEEPKLPPPKTVPVRKVKTKTKKKKKKVEEGTPIAALCSTAAASGFPSVDMSQDMSLTTEKTVSLRPKEGVPTVAPLPEEMTVVPVCPPAEEVVPVQPNGIIVDNTKLIAPVKTEMIVSSPLKLVTTSQFIEQPFVQAVMPVQMPVTYQIPIVKLSQTSGMFFSQIPNYIIPPSPAMLPTPQVPAFRNGFHFSTGGTIQFQASTTTLQQTASGFMQSTNSSGFQIVQSPATTNIQQSVLTAFQNTSGIGNLGNLKSPTLRLLNCQPLILNNAKPLANVNLTLTNVSSMTGNTPAVPNPISVNPGMSFPGMGEPAKTGRQIISGTQTVSASVSSPTTVTTTKKMMKQKLNILPKPSVTPQKGGVVDGTKSKKQCLQPCGPSAATATGTAT